MARAKSGTTASSIAVQQELTARRAEVERLRIEVEQLVDNQRLLEERRERYEDLYDFAPFGLLLLDGAGIIRELNAAAAFLLQLDRPKARGLPLAGFVADRRAFRRQLADARARRTPTHVEADLVSSGPVATRVEVILQRAAVGDSYRVAILDVSDRVRLLATQRAARASSDAKDSFIAMLSHELRTPLAPVLMAATALNAGKLGRTKTAEMLTLIQANVEVQVRLIDDLLDMTRIVRGKMQLRSEQVDLHDLVDKTAAMVRDETRAKELSLVIELDAGERTVMGDPVRLRQIFWNLLKNAIKFSPPGGQIAVRSWNSGEGVAIEVSDQGTGLPASALERVFHPFEQVHPEMGSGLGLGLPIARGIAELHGGTIAASSAGENAGSRFVVQLPVVARAVSVARAPEVAGPLPAKRAANRHILLVEDHPATAAAISTSLRANGYSVQNVNTMSKALRADLRRISLVISDIGLPDGDGVTLLRRLRKKAKVRAIALSGYGTERDVRASLHAGFAVHLVKPVTLATLLGAIEATLAAAR